MHGIHFLRVLGMTAWLMSWLFMIPSTSAIPTTAIMAGIQRQTSPLKRSNSQRSDGSAYVSDSDSSAVGVSTRFPPLAQTTEHWKTRFQQIWASALVYRFKIQEKAAVRPGTSSIPARRVLAIGDLHANMETTRHVLQVAGLIDEQDQWIAEPGTVVVQMGDVLDHGMDSLDTLRYLQTMQSLAKQHGCEFHLLLGNHEHVNFRRKDHKNLNLLELESRFDNDLEKRWRTFSFGGPVWKWIQDWPVALRIRDSVFVHAGFTVESAKLGVDYYNTMWRRAVLNRWETAEESRILGKNADIPSPLYTRMYKKMKSAEDHAERCAEVEQVVQLLGVRRMIIGHLTTKDNRIRATCNGKLIFVDTAINEGYLSALELDYENTSFDDEDDYDDKLPVMKALYPKHQEMVVSDDHQPL